MATKTITVDRGVYDRLESTRREGESFSKAISRLLDDVGTAHTGADILSRLDQRPSLTETDVEEFIAVVDEARASESWKPV